MKKSPETSRETFDQMEGYRRNWCDELFKRFNQLGADNVVLVSTLVLFIDPMDSEQVNYFVRAMETADLDLDGVDLKEMEESALKISAPAGDDKLRQKMKDENTISPQMILCRMKKIYFDTNINSGHFNNSGGNR